MELELVFCPEDCRAEPFQRFPARASPAAAGSIPPRGAAASGSSSRGGCGSGAAGADAPQPDYSRLEGRLLLSKDWAGEVAVEAAAAATSSRGTPHGSASSSSSSSSSGGGEDTGIHIQEDPDKLLLTKAEAERLLRAMLGDKFDSVMAQASCASLSAGVVQAWQLLAWHPAHPLQFWRQPSADNRDCHHPCSRDLVCRIDAHSRTFKKRKKGLRVGHPVPALLGPTAALRCRCPTRRSGWGRRRPRGAKSEVRPTRAAAASPSPSPLASPWTLWPERWAWACFQSVNVLDGSLLTCTLTGALTGVGK